MWYVPCSCVSSVIMGASDMFHIPIMLLSRPVCFVLHCLEVLAQTSDDAVELFA